MAEVAAVTATINVPTDAAQAQVAALTARITELKYKLDTIGTEDLDKFYRLNRQLADTQAQLVKVQDAGAAGADGLEKVGKSAVASGQQLQQVEGIAIRLIERLAILYAVRGTFNFVVSLYEEAAALEKTASSLDISIDKTQELQYASEKAGVTLQFTTAAIDTLDKKLAAGGGGITATLDELGLSFDKIWKMNAGDRFDVVAMAVAGVEDRIKRAGLEVALFGTDKIDPLIKRLKDLEEAAVKPYSKEDAAILSQTAESYGRLGEKLKELGVIALSKGVQFAAMLLRIPGTQLPEFINDPTLGPGGIFGPTNPGFQQPKFTLPGPDPNSTTGRADITAVEKEETAEARQHLEVLKKQEETIHHIYDEQSKLTGLIQAENAKSYGITAQILQLTELQNLEKARVESVLKQISIFSIRNKIEEESDTRIIELEKQKIVLAEKLLQYTNAQVIEELKAKEAIAASSGFSVSGNRLEPGSPAVEAQKKIDLLKSSSGNSDTTQREQQIRNDLIHSMDSELTLIIGKTAADRDAIEVTKKATESVDGLSEAFDSLGNSVSPGGVSSLGSSDSSDPRVRALMSQGYSLGEATSIVSGSGTSIGASSLVRGLQGGGGSNVTIHMSGMMLSDDPGSRSVLRRHVQTAVEDAMRQGRKLGAA